MKNMTFISPLKMYFYISGTANSHTEAEKRRRGISRRGGFHCVSALKISALDFAPFSKQEMEPIIVFYHSGRDVTEY